MKFEESSLTGYLVKNLEPLTEADPVILAEYVVALLKNDKPTKELQKLCTDNLVDFLGHGTNSFIIKLFQALEDGSIVRSGENVDVIGKLEPSQPSIIVDPSQLKSSSPKEENHSTSSGPSDPEDKEITDDDDDDRNHKHRRREARSHSYDKDIQEQHFRMPNRKRNKPYENGQLFLETDPQRGEVQKEYNPNLERDISSKFEKRRYGLTPPVRPPLDFGQRTRVNQPFRTDLGPRFDLSMSIGRPPSGRGRGRSTVPWGQHDSRFNPLETFDFASQMASQGPTHPSLFVGAGLPSAASTQGASWGAFGFIPGMSNGILDPLHPLGLQGALQPPIAPLNLGMPRQRCRDFEERGFCLRGDMCPMEHGVNRIVVEDVQSLSQFNLPVSIPSTRTLGIQAGTGSLPPVTASSSLLTSSKALPSKSSKSGVTDDALGVSGVLSASGGAEADVYDPDQPLWNNDRPETSNALLRNFSPKTDNSEHFWDADTSNRQSFRLLDGLESEHPSKSFTASIGSQSTTSVWGRIGSGNKFEMASKIDPNVTTKGNLGNEMLEDHDEVITSNRASDQGKHAATEGVGPKEATIQPVPRPRTDSRHNGGRASQKASRTVFVNGIPQNSNRKDTLLSHFKKFGKVIDIYIPLNGEKAFVQFSKREEAEAALKAPDAVMGNRFIKLWWANRDNIPDEGESSVHAKPVALPNVVVTSAPSQPCVVDRGKENLPSVVPKEGDAPAAETSVPFTGPPKNLMANGPKATPPVQKKLENLELLKEELRKKQEMLAQKRNDFRRQLDKLEKQAVSIKKSEVVSEQAVKRQKLEKGTEGVKAATPRTANLCTREARQEVEKAMEKSNSGEIIVSPCSNPNSTISQQSPRSIKQASRLPAPSLNRFKLDNRPGVFRILPPLPADFANLAALKEQFSSFSDLSSVELEDPEADPSNEELKTSSNCSARITFTTRRSAERAFLTGKCWQGHSLQFKWLTVSSNPSNVCGTQGVSPSSTPKGACDVEIQAESVTSDLSPSSVRNSTCSVIAEAAAVRNGESIMDVEGTNCASVCVPQDLEQTSQSNSLLSSCEKMPPKSDVPVVEDDINIGFAQ